MELRVGVPESPKGTLFSNVRGTVVVRAGEGDRTGVKVGEGKGRGTVGVGYRRTKVSGERGRRGPVE